MTNANLTERAKAFLECFEKRDLKGCMDFFHQDAVIYFGPGTYRGREAIEEWHKDRFEAGLKLLSLEKVGQEGTTVSASVVAISDKIKAWGLDTLEALVTISFDGLKIKEARFSLLKGNPLESWSE